MYNLDPTRKGFGYGVNGAMTRYVKVPARCLHRVPDALPFEQACLTEPCSVAYNAVVVNSHVRPGDRVMVLGPGTIGILCAAMAHLCGAGVSATLQIALKLVRPNGQITKVGWGPQPLNFSLDALVQKNVTLQGSFSHNWPIWEKVLALLTSGRLDVRPIIGGVWPVTDWHTAFEAMHSGKVVKSILKPV